MKSVQPLLSVLVPIFNIGHYLPDSFDSLLQSSYKNIEIIAIDDFSKDDSWKILRIYKQLDKRVRIYQNVKHYGKAVTLNRLLRKAKGEFVIFMDGKDMVYKHKFKKQVKFLEENPKIAAVGTQCTFINAKGRKTGASNFPTDKIIIYQRPLHGITIDFETMMINRQKLPKDALYFNAQSTLLYSDIIMKLLQYGQIANLNSLLQYRRTESPNRKTNLQKIPSIIKLWIKSMDTYDYQFSIRNLFSSFKQPDLTTH